MHISKEEARIHNLVNRFAKNKELLNSGQLSKLDLTDKLFFRAEDFKIAIDGNIFLIGLRDTYSGSFQLLIPFVHLSGCL